MVVCHCALSRGLGFALPRVIIIFHRESDIAASQMASSSHVSTVTANLQGCNRRGVFGPLIAMRL